MAATWKVVACDYDKSLNDEVDVITNVHWEVTDEDGDHFGRVYGASSIDTSDLSGFIAYASVTANNAIAWAKDVLGADQVTASENSVAAQITESKTPTIGTGTPW